MRPLQEMVILSTGRTRPRITIPLIVPDAVPGNASFQLIFVVSAPLPTTVPLPIKEASTVPREVRVIDPRRSEMSQIRLFIGSY